MRKNIEIIQASSEIGAGIPGAGKGPGSVMQLLRAKDSPLIKSTNPFKVVIDNEQGPEIDSPFARNISKLTPALEKVSSSVEHSLEKGYFPLLLTGDHSNAIGSVSGFRNYFSESRIGIIWIDAHLDMHSPLTTPSGNIHGMALNALLGDDNKEHKINTPDDGVLQEWEKLKHLGSHGISPKVLPENVVYIGVRDYEEEELALVKTLGITVITPAEIDASGIHFVLEKTLKILEDCERIYVSFDVDSLDTTISRGTGTPVDGGLNMEDAKFIFGALFNHPKVAAMEITEINPDLDTDNKMSEAVVELLDSLD